MARYIDADKLIETNRVLLEHAQMNGMYNHARIYERFVHSIEETPTADVVPKSEVAPKRDRYYIEEGKPPVLIETSDNRRSKIAREIFEEINMQIFPYSTDIYIKGEELIIIPKSDYNAILTELKKKYTEDQNNEN